jgi:syntaxin-binding protein 1
MFAPILHEFTYQAMAFDLLPMEDGKFVFGTPGAADKDNERKEIFLDETDVLWTQLRHRHIADAISIIMSQFNKFLTENKAASTAMGGKGKCVSINSKLSLQLSLRHLVTPC